MWHFIGDACSAGSDNSQNNILWGLIPRLTKSCGVSDPAEQSSAGLSIVRCLLSRRGIRPCGAKFCGVVHCPVSFVRFLVSVVPYLVSPVLCPMSHVLCPLSHLPFHLSCVLCPMSLSNVTCFCPVSPVQCPLSRVPCPRSHISCPVSPFLCPLSPVQFPMYWFMYEFCHAYFNGLLWQWISFHLLIARKVSW
jgi:hypothetical protein